MLFGLTEDTIKQIKSVFSMYKDVKKVILYGSRAKGHYSNGSDIDLTIIESELNLNVLHRIESDLDDLLLPYSIDLSLFSHIENDNLIDHINRIGKEFYNL